MKKYPFVSAEMVRASSSKLATRLDAEIDANRVEADVFEYSPLYLDDVAAAARRASAI